MGARWYCNPKRTVESCLSLSIFKLRQWGYLNGITKGVLTWSGRNSEEQNRIAISVDTTADYPFCELCYMISGNQSHHSYRIALSSTGCRYGGRRFWFQCPGCSKRVATLFLASRERHFRCRECNDLTYWSRNRCVIESHGHISRQIDKLRREIKRWTWRGRPTRQARRLRALEQRMGLYSPQIWAQMDKLKRRVMRH